ncbi:hypothetical protein EMPS_07240 [Entomortierella parvispora]|uniref:Uncharacterized protein n=1 Tax=Entomortierella parvispora TaxID=205924 RepID=A0A9P3HEJ8_9FUNG|nr:hypothetical protein EMPS_07240 [Entomortierella parvispora]
MRHHLDWALAIQDGSVEHVSIKSFSEKFNYINRGDAEEAYQHMISSNEILKPRRVQLLKDFHKFKTNGANGFWARRSTDDKASILLLKASVGSMSAGYEQSKLEYKRRLTINRAIAEEDFRKRPKLSQSAPSSKTSLGKENSELSLVRTISEELDDSKSDECKLDDGRSDDGRSDDGRSDDGRSDDGKSDDGKSDDGKSDDGNEDDDGEPNEFFKGDDGESDGDSKNEDGCKNDDGISDDGNKDDANTEDFLLPNGSEPELEVLGCIDELDTASETWGDRDSLNSETLQECYATPDVDEGNGDEDEGRALSRQCVHGPDFLSSDPLDQSICSESFSMGSLEEPVPIRIDRMVGPGTLSNHLSGESNYWEESVNVSKMLMEWRHEQVDDQSFLTDHDIPEILSLSFIFNHPLVNPLQERERALWLTGCSEKENKFITDVALVCMEQERDQAEQALFSLAMKESLMTSLVFRAARSLMETNALWAEMVLIHDNEDSIIDRFFKPLVSAFLGNIEGTKLSWTRDALQTGIEDAGELLYPDCMVSTTKYPQQTVLVAEVKKFEATQQECDRDRLKLYVEMKRSLDGLLSKGVDGPVVGLLVQRHRVEVWVMTLPYEALYLPTHIGSFDMILSRYYFGALHAVCPPLLAARAAVMNTMSKLSGSGRRKPLKAAWTRGTYNVEPVRIVADLSIREEVRGLRHEGTVQTL